MQQWGLLLNASPQIDNLNYTYQNSGAGNKLRAVNDATGSTDNHVGDFTDKNTSADDYGYDQNGNLITDLNKRLNGNTGVDQATGGAITYNYLNLPWQITVKNDDGSAKGSITYIYDAAGNKLEKRVNELAATANGNTPKQTNTAYLGSVVYENSVLQFFGHEEGRVRPKFSVVSGQPATAFVYDYFLKDHLGNTRVVLTDEQQTDAYQVASLEATPLPTEKLYYDGLDNGRVNKSTVTGYPTDTYTNPNDFIQQLSGATGGNKTGSSILLKVMAGDKVNVRVNSWYKLNGVTPAGNTSPLTDIINALINSVPEVSGNKILQPQIAGTVLNPSVTGFLANRDANTNTSKPKAYINIVLLDEQLNPVLTNDGNNSYFEQVGGDNIFTTHNITGRPITRSGYLYIYVSNETQNVNVFFDNLQVTQVRGPLLETTDYYPFGLTIAGISSKAAGSLINKRRFNGGNELQSEDFSDGSGLELYDAHYRLYDPQLGRFGQIDKLGDINFDISLYVYVKNNPISFNDPTGLIDDEPTKKKGKPGFSKDNPNILPDVIVKSSNHRFQTFGWYGYTTITDTHFSGNLASFIQRMRGNEDVLQPGDRYSYIDDVMNGKLLDWYLKEAEAKQFEEDFYSIYFGLVTLPEDVVGVVGIYGKGIRLLPKLTSSTSRVFYSGGPEARIAATAYAKAFDMVSMEMTIKGRILAALTKMTSKEFMKGAIEKTSASFAKGAEGTARVFHNVEGVPLDGIWKEHEYPNIRKEVNLIFHDVIP